jgi:hypothetical protein
MLLIQCCPTDIRSGGHDVRACCRRLDHMIERQLVHSPLPLFSGNGLTLPSPSARTSCPEPASRRDLSLARNDCPFAGPPFRGQRFRPATSLPCCTVFRPVDLLLPRLPAASTPRQAASTLRPGARKLSSTPGFSSDLHSPLGLFFPSGSKRSIRFGPGQARFPNPPDLPSLPVTGSR